MCSRISSGRSFSDIGSLVNTGVSEQTSFFSYMLMLSAPDNIQVQKY